MSLPVGRADRRSAGLAAGVAMLLIAQQVAAKAARDALFLSEFATRYLPVVIVASAILAVLVVVVVSRLLTRWAPARVVPFLFTINALMLAVGWWLTNIDPRITAVLVYVQTAAVGAALISSFWSVVNERYDPHSAKLLVGRIGAGAAAGGVIGGLAAWQISAWLSVPSLLLALAVANVFVALGVRRIGAPEHAVHTTTKSEESGLAIVRGTPYLRLLVSIVALGALADTTLDYVFKATAAGEYDTATELTAFFSLFHTIVGIATLSVQAVFTRYSLRRAGLATTASSYPGMLLLGGIGAVAFPVLWVLAIVRGVATSVENSLFRSAYELTYTPLPPSKKRPTKTLIDVGGAKVATVVGGGLAFVIVSALPGEATWILLGITIAAGGAALALTALLHQGYVDALAAGLRSGAVDLDDDLILDATTRQTFADTESIDRRKLLEQISLLRAGQKSEEEPRPTVPGVDSLLRALATGDASGVEASGAGVRLRGQDVDTAIRGLAREATLKQTVHALRELGALAVPGLVAALLDETNDPVVRRRIPRVLRETATQQVADALALSLTDQHFPVRYRAAVALLSVSARNSEIVIDRQLVFAAAHRELADPERTPMLTDDGDEGRSPFDEDAVVSRVGRSLAFVFTVLALVFDREPLHLAFCALGTDDTALRGTGIEYLDSVLPNHLRAELTPYFSRRDVVKKRSRPRQQIVNELLQSRDTLAFDRKRLLEMINPPPSTDETS